MAKIHLGPRTNIIFGHQVLGQISFLGTRFKDKSHFWALGPRAKLIYLDRVHGQNDQIYAKSRDKNPGTHLKIPKMSSEPSEMARKPQNWLGKFGKYSWTLPAKKKHVSRQRSPRTNLAKFGWVLRPTQPLSGLVLRPT